MLIRPWYLLLGFLLGVLQIFLRPQQRRSVIVMPNPLDESQWQFIDAAGNTFEIHSRPVPCGGVPWTQMLSMRPQ